MFLDLHDANEEGNEFETQINSLEASRSPQLELDPAQVALPQDTVRSPSTMESTVSPPLTLSQKRVDYGL